jgi:hypothetical protein
VTVAAIDTVVAHVVLMAELHRLRARDSYFGQVGRTVDGGDGGEKRQQYRDAAEDAHARNGVGAPMEYLSHRRRYSISADFEARNYNIP